jgi:hypothetical protein
MSDHTRHIYVIGTASSGPLKIGVAKNVRARLGGIQNGNPARLEVLFSSEVPFVDAPAIERRSHALLKAYRLTGEWFDVSAEQAVAAIREAIPSPPAKVRQPPRENRWTVRGIPRDGRETANHHARIRGEGVGAWIGRAILAQWEREQAERTTFD